MCIAGRLSTKENWNVTYLFCLQKAQRYDRFRFVSNSEDGRMHRLPRWRSGISHSWSEEWLLVNCVWKSGQGKERRQLFLLHHGLYQSPHTAFRLNDAPACLSVLRTSCCPQKKWQFALVYLDYTVTLPQKPRQQTIDIWLVLRFFKEPAWH